MAAVFALFAVFAVFALFALFAVFAVFALFALFALSACNALGTLPSVDSLMSLPVSELFFTFDPVTALARSLPFVTAAVFSCFFPTEFAGSVIAA